MKLPVGDGIADGRDEVSLRRRRAGGAARGGGPGARRSCGPSSLTPVARLRTRRRRWRLQGPDGDELAELVDDRVSVLQRGRVAERFREIEIEGRGIDRDALERIAGVVARDGVEPAEQIPKLVRALGERADGAARRGRPAAACARATRPAVAVRAAIARGVQRIMLNDARTRLGEVEPLHQMRVGTRRLRSDLRTFRDLLDPEWARTMRDELKWLGAALGDVRDLDVMLERLRADGAGPRAPPRRPVRGARGAARGGAGAPARGAARPALREPAGPARGGGRGAAADGRGRPARRGRCCRRSRATRWRKAGARRPGTRATRARTRTTTTCASAPSGRATRPRRWRRRWAAARRAGASASRKRAADVQDVLGELQDAVVAEETIERFAR